VASAASRREVTLLAKPGGADFGLGRYAAALAEELPKLGWRTRVARSTPPWPAAASGVARRLGPDPDAFWSSYPLIAPAAGLLHVTGQTLAIALLLRPRGGTVATVHDLIPYATRDDPALTTLRHPIDLCFYRQAMRGLARATVVLADSAYTASEVLRLTAVDRAAIQVVPLGVDAARFRPVYRPVDGLLAKHSLDASRDYVLYVGSEDPRKNLTSLWRAVAMLAPRYPRLRLLKVGRGHHPAQRRGLVELGAELRIAPLVHFVEEVTDEELAALYGVAALCVVPSLYEGFGLPVLEAMACGAAVVSANRTSLPEVAGDAALLVEPTPAGLAEGIERVLSDAALGAELRARGRRRAETYSWRRTAEATAEAYERAIEQSRKH
jgi:glycosyltransferase involved in cell wall biosynthesis